MSIESKFKLMQSEKDEFDFLYCSACFYKCKLTNSQSVTVCVNSNLKALLQKHHLNTKVSRK